MVAWVAANPDAMAELSSLDGLTFDSVEGSMAVGSTGDGSPVCVVCEVGGSTDAGLGIVLRIAAVQDGGMVIWVNAGQTDSHAAAVSWLNRSTSPRFLLVRATAVRIDGSAVAPLFDLVVRPPRASDQAGAPVQRRDPAADAPIRRVGDAIPDE
jgi:hypothetical protein